MNRRIRKKKEKQSIMEYSFEIVPNHPMKRRRKIVNKLWQMYTGTGKKLEIGYKRKVEENDNE